MQRFAALSLFLFGCNSHPSPAPEPSAPGAPSLAEAPAAPAANPATTSAPSAPAPSTGKAVIGQPAPDFTLTDLDGKTHRLADHRGSIVVLEWFNPDCPFVRQSHEHGSLAGMARRVSERGVVWLAINSNAPGKQGSGKEANEAGRKRYGIDHPILLDESGEVGQRYEATHTPHMYVIDEQGTLVYRGAIDNTRGGDIEDVPEVENYVETALAALAANKPIPTPETKAFGCTVKYPR